MPTFSIVVTAYNNAQYLPGCLGSLVKQSYSDWECIVVNDASPDETRAIATAQSEADVRFSVHSLATNSGLHLARKAGIERCSGDYVIFLDADDELAPDALGQLGAVLAEQPVDILHFGMKAVNCGVNEQELTAFETYVNKTCEPLDREDLCEAVFGTSYAQDWRVTQRVYRTAYAQEAFAVMTDKRLERAEDAYEFFVLADRSRGELTCDVPALRYFYGRGVTGTSEIDVTTFARFSRQFAACLAAIDAYASRDGADPALAGWAEGAREKLYGLLMNDWHVRVADKDKVAAAHKAAETLGSRVIATQLMRLARDDAYALWVTGGHLEGTEAFITWYWLAEELMAGVEDASTSKYSLFRDKACDHISDLEHLSGTVEGSPECVHPIRSSSYARQPVRIFVTTHKDVNVFWGNVLEPVQVGVTHPRKRLRWALQDDAGENISDLNATYCELTTQYWAWKNVYDAEYVGFCHYRRYFDFSGEEHDENSYGEVMDQRIDWGSQARYGLDDASIIKAVQGCDVVTTRVRDLRKFPEGFSTVREQYAAAAYLDVADLNRVMDLVCQMYPEYAQDVEAYLAEPYTCFCNMFVMRYEFFDRYCEWLFPVLERFVDDWDTSYLSHERLRTPGHLAERLLNVFLKHEQRVRPKLVWKQVQCVHFEHPEPVVEVTLAPVDGQGLPVVPVVFAASDAYVPMLTTTVFSMLKNASPDYFYDVVVFERDITERNKDIMHSFFAQFPNAALRFADVRAALCSYDLKTSNAYISAETYYRFLIQSVLPGYDKVLYLDSDLIVLGDVAELFETDLADNAVGAVIDIDYLGNLNMSDGARMAYTYETLGLKDPYGYFQAGVLVFNTAALRKLHTVEEWLNLAARDVYIYDDQDILNAECQGCVTYLDPSWNVMNDCDGRIAKVFSFAPANVYDAYCAAYVAPKIVHYAGYEKPWKAGHCDERELYFAYARQTPFYETLLSMMASEPCNVTQKPKAKSQHERAVSEGNVLRKVFDPLFPLGTRRREFVKSFVRKLRGRD